MSHPCGGQRPGCWGTSDVQELQVRGPAGAVSQVSTPSPALLGVARCGEHAVAGHGDQQATQCLWAGASQRPL